MGFEPRLRDRLRVSEFENSFVKLIASCKRGFTHQTTGATDEILMKHWLLSKAYIADETLVVTCIAVLIEISKGALPVF